MPETGSVMERCSGELNIPSKLTWLLLGLYSDNVKLNHEYWGDVFFVSFRSKDRMNGDRGQTISLFVTGSIEGQQYK